MDVVFSPLSLSESHLLQKERGKAGYWDCNIIEHAAVSESVLRQGHVQLQLVLFGPDRSPDPSTAVEYRVEGCGKVHLACGLSDCVCHDNRCFLIP